MPTYLVLSDWTGEGLAEVAESPNRLDDARELAASMDGEVREFFMTMGRHDIAALIEMPDDDAMARFALALGKRGAVTTETLRAFPEEEYREIVGDVP
ncbi:GYD domain-containing protein [Halomarina pelagica]|uniref:GYD domain-containing protein n=1 Tax=Halomarina pelagica TaxID=2961599 RepID=UPI0020C3F9B7|nr:GYD domain-containing protein [Halomarina sp. BND7]